MTYATGCILLLALLVRDTSNSRPPTSRKMVNDNENFQQIRTGNALNICDNTKTHHNKTELLNRLKENNPAEERYKARKTKRDASSNHKPDKKKRGVTYQERIDLLVAHNHWRRVVDNPQASNMIHMVWSVKLEKIALYWALNCRYDEGLPDNLPDKYRHPGVGIGQNIWAGNGSNIDVKSATEDFYNEKMNYSSTDRSTCDQKNRCRHYKQMVWAESIYLGCAIVYCPTYVASSRIDKEVFNLVCNYSPEGNRLSVDGTPVQPYRIGPRGTQCPPTHLQVEDGLCRSTPPCSDVTDCDSPSDTNTCLCDPSYYEGSEEFSRSKIPSEDSEKSAEATFLKSLVKGESCSSITLKVSSVGLSFSVFVALIVTSALSIDRVV